MRKYELMDRIATNHNILDSFESVKENKGCPGIDGMTITEAEQWLGENMPKLRRVLKSGRYLPKDLLKLEIPKPNGGKRKLGIPTVLDRVIQEAIRAKLEPYFEEQFSEFSYGFRPGRSQHDALKQCQKYVQAGYQIVVDIDLKQFFDNIDHSRLMTIIAPRIKDRLVSRLIGRFLKAGERFEGQKRDPRAKHYTKEKGVPQGGPLSPLLSNILLDKLDKFLEKEGLKFVRYADDCRIFVKTEMEGWLAYKRAVEFLEKELGLPVNEEKSQVDDIDNRPFLGYKVSKDGKLHISRKALQKKRNELKRMTQRNRLIPRDLFKRLNAANRGWINYFKLASDPRPIKLLDGLLRQRLRTNKLKSLKTRNNIFKTLWRLCRRNIKNASRKLRAYCLGVAKSGKGWVRRANTKAVKSAYTNRYFRDKGLFFMYDYWLGWQSSNT